MNAQRDLIRALRAWATGAAEGMAYRADLAREADQYQASEVADLAASQFAALGERLDALLARERARLAEAVEATETKRRELVERYGDWTLVAAHYDAELAVARQALEAFDAEGARDDGDALYVPRHRQREDPLDGGSVHRLERADRPARRPLRRISASIGHALRPGVPPDRRDEGGAPHAGSEMMQLHQIPPDLVPDIARDAIALYRAFGADPDQAVAKAVAEMVEGCAVDVEALRAERATELAPPDIADWPF